MIPTPHTVTVRRFEAGAEDAHGNPVDAWSATELSLPAHFVAPATSAEPNRQNRDLLTTDKTVGAPKHANLPGPRDLVSWGGEDYRVEGEVADYTFGPWSNPAAGVTFLIRKVAG
jgi:hypothetical protein